MSVFEPGSAWADLAASAWMLLAASLGAWLLSSLIGRILGRAASRTATDLDDRLVRALQRPFGQALFLVGVYVAFHRLRLLPPWHARFDAALFVAFVLVLSVALVRAYVILIDWYSARSHLRDEGLTAGFGPLLSRVGRAFIAVLAVITILQRFGVNVASLVVSLGVGSLALGLAAQDTLSNMFAGFTLMLDRPFRVGDRIQLASGEVGDVETIGMRATRLRTPDETVLVVPNSMLVKDRLVNQSHPTRRIVTRVEVAVAQGTDVAMAKRLLVDAAAGCATVDSEVPPVALLSRLADGAVVFTLVFRARDYAEQALAKSEVLEQVERRLAQAGVEIAAPPRVLLAEREASLKKG
ncbi:MAG TPA: mechanosensitive ion channel domain-containing protein [Vicinamibacteria bacterium]